MAIYMGEHGVFEMGNGRLGRTTSKRHLSRDDMPGTMIRTTVIPINVRKYRSMEENRAPTERLSEREVTAEGGAKQETFLGSFSPRVRSEVGNIDSATWFTGVARARILILLSGEESIAVFDDEDRQILLCGARGLRGRPVRGDGTGPIAADWRSGRRHWSDQSWILYPVELDRMGYPNNAQRSFEDLQHHRDRKSMQRWGVRVL